MAIVCCLCIVYKFYICCNSNGHRFRLRSLFYPSLSLFLNVSKTCSPLSLSLSLSFSVTLVASHRPRRGLSSCVCVCVFGFAWGGGRYPPCSKSSS